MSGGAALHLPPPRGGRTAATAAAAAAAMGETRRRRAQVERELHLVVEAPVEEGAGLGFVPEAQEPRAARPPAVAPALAPPVRCVLGVGGREGRAEGDAAVVTQERRRQRHVAVVGVVGSVVGSSLWWGSASVKGAPKPPFESPPLRGVTCLAKRPLPVFRLF